MKKDTLTFGSTAASARLDAAGMMASTMCALHCAAMPLAVTLLPLAGLGFLASEAVEWGLLGVSALLGIGSLCLGYRLHRSRRALAVLACGLALLLAGRAAERREWDSWGVALVVSGGLAVAVAHGINRHLCRTCDRCGAQRSSDAPPS